MEITVEHLKNAFEKYNKLYFDNILRQPEFKISRSKQCLGRFIARYHRLYNMTSYTIEVSNYYIGDEKYYDGTLIHEMIHLYLHYLKIKDDAPHGTYFMAKAHEINKFGWDINATENVDKLPVNPTYQREYCGMIIHVSENNFFLFSIAQNKIQYFAWKIQKYKFDVILSNDYHLFNKLPQCRTRINGIYIKEKEYLQIMKNVKKINLS